MKGKRGRSIPTHPTHPPAVVDRPPRRGRELLRLRLRLGLCPPRRDVVRLCLLGREGYCVF